MKKLFTILLIGVTLNLSAQTTTTYTAKAIDSLLLLVKTYEMGTGYTLVNNKANVNFDSVFKFQTQPLILGLTDRIKILESTSAILTKKVDSIITWIKKPL